DLYFNCKLELQIDKEKGEKYLMLAAKNSDKDAITLYEKNKINFINKQNYFEKFKIARNIHKSRNINNGQEVEKINRKLFDKLYKEKYHELD
ncbi:5874_t:CDS:1, partial [Dentiscutata erythropus]